MNARCPGSRTGGLVLWSALGWMLMLVALCPTVLAQERITLPSGHWVRHLSPPGQGEIVFDMILDIGGDDFMFFNFYDRAAEKWKPVLVEGAYEVTRSAPGDFDVDFKVDRVERKGISRGRENVFSQVLKETKQLGIPMRPGKTLKVTLEFGCKGEKEQVLVCIKNPGGKPACRTLDGESCRGIFKVPGEPPPLPPEERSGKKK